MKLKYKIIKWLQQLTCKHTNKTLVVTNVFLTVEIVATVCLKCKKILKTNTDL